MAKEYIFKCRKCGQEKIYIFNPLTCFGRAYKCHGEYMEIDKDKLFLKNKVYK